MAKTGDILHMTYQDAKGDWFGSWIKLGTTIDTVNGKDVIIETVEQLDDIMATSRYMALMDKATGQRVFIRESPKAL